VGISESAYDLTDRLGNYQYKEFGVPGLGLKRGLGDELVVAPYATALAALLEPVEAARNLRRLVGEGAEVRLDTTTPSTTRCASRSRMATPRPRDPATA